MRRRQRRRWWLRRRLANDYGTSSQVHFCETGCVCGVSSQRAPRPADFSKFPPRVPVYTPAPLQGGLARLPRPCTTRGRTLANAANQRSRQGSGSHKMLLDACTRWALHAPCAVLAGATTQLLEYCIATGSAIKCTQCNFCYDCLRPDATVRVCLVHGRERVSISTRTRGICCKGERAGFFLHLSSCS